VAKVADDNSSDVPRLIDGQGRRIEYVRMSVTDRCDLRCVYCMAEEMTFLPRAQVLSLEEIERLAGIFVQQGVSKIRLTGGEPLVRRGIVDLCGRISAMPGLRELVMTTNGSQLSRLAKPLADAGVSRLNISLDSLDPEKFKAITRTGDLQQILDGIEAARGAGFKRIKLNTVVMKGRNAEEVPALVDYALARDLDITFIEEMPLGDVGRSRGEAFCSSDEVRDLISQSYRLIDSTESSGGPARYVRVEGYSSVRIGFISPHSHNFCATCNRVRMTAEGRLLLCLGQENAIDMRALLRRHPTSDAPILAALDKALQHKPAHHDFNIHGDVQIVRFMNASGG
tara:strand:+ start:50337 stop:51359 length:1023 start_codon:yes stop_codon:yes gene_type:complete